MCLYWPESLHPRVLCFFSWSHRIVFYWACCFPTQAQIKSYMTMLLKGVAYLHGNSIMHRVSVNHLMETVNSLRTITAPATWISYCCSVDYASTATPCSYPMKWKSWGIAVSAYRTSNQPTFSSAQLGTSRLQTLAWPECSLGRVTDSTAIRWPPGQYIPTPSLPDDFVTRPSPVSVARPPLPSSLFFPSFRS